MRYFLLLYWVASQALAADLAVGQPAPEISARLLDSPDTFVLSQQAGKTVIVNFWATWCAPCKAELPALQAYYLQHKAQGLEILAISMDDPRDLEAVRRVAAQYPFRFALRADSSFAGLGRIWRLPTSFVVDSTGILRKNGHKGDAEIQPAELESVVTPLFSHAALAPN